MLNKILSRIEEIFISIALLAVCILLFVNVVTRYGFGYSIKWAEEFARYVIVWITFIGGSYCVREHAHVGIDVLLMKFPISTRWKMETMLALLCLVYCGSLTMIGWLLLQSVIQSGQISPTMMIPMGWAYAAIPVGGLLMGIRYIQVVVGYLQHKERYKKKDWSEDSPW